MCCRPKKAGATSISAVAIGRSFYFRTTDVTGQVTLPAGEQIVLPGDNCRLTTDLIKPIAMEEGLRFAIREGGRTIGAGIVTKILK